MKGALSVGKTTKTSKTSKTSLFAGSLDHIFKIGAGIVVFLIVAAVAWFLYNHLRGGGKPQVIEVMAPPAAAIPAA